MSRGLASDLAASEAKDGRAHRRALFLGWTMVVAVLLALPVVPMPPGIEMQLAIPGVDKVAHFLIVFVHVILGRRAFSGSTRLAAPVLAATAFALVWSLGLELLQEWIPGRSSSLGDAVADGLGAVLALLPWPFARVPPA